MNSIVLNSNCKEKFTTYKKDKNGKEIINKEYRQIDTFWRHNKEKLLSCLFYSEEYINPKYDIARNTIMTYYYNNYIIFY